GSLATFIIALLARPQTRWSVKACLRRQHFARAKPVAKTNLDNLPCATWIACSSWRFPLLSRDMAGGNVAQISNLLYRRFVIGCVLEHGCRCKLAGTQQNAILRYGKLEICA